MFKNVGLEVVPWGALRNFCCRSCLRKQSIFRIDLSGRDSGSLYSGYDVLFISTRCKIWRDTLVVSCCWIDTLRVYRAKSKYIQWVPTTMIVKYSKLVDGGAQFSVRSRYRETRMSRCRNLVAFAYTSNLFLRWPRAIDIIYIRLGMGRVAR
jgi:hypothetical protein